MTRKNRCEESRKQHANPISDKNVVTREKYQEIYFAPSHLRTRGRSLLHLAVLEALYIRKLDPELCVQKENVLSLQLFGTVRREGAK